MFDVHLLIPPKPIKETSMKKLLTAIAAAIFLIYPCVCFSSYIIHLKDGRKFTTEQYYEEGDQIKFKRYGGVIGIQKDLVREIEVVEEVEELPEEKVSPKQEAPAAKTEAEKQGTSESAEKAVEVEKSKEQGEPEKGSEEEKGAAERPVAKEDDKEGQGIDVEYYKNQQKELMERYKEAKKKLNDAILRNDKRARWEAKKEIKEIHEKLAELISELKSVNKAVLPEWWHDGAKSQKPDH